MAKCPKCRATLVSMDRCEECNWIKSIESTVKKRDSNPYKHGLKVGDHWTDKQCSFIDSAGRCPAYGHMAFSTNGEGPWYCRHHFSILTHAPQYEVKFPQDSMEEVDKRVNRLVQRMPNESTHDWSMRCREWTIERINHGFRMREPGEDG